MHITILFRKKGLPFRLYFIVDKLAKKRHRFQGNHCLILSFLQFPRGLHKYQILRANCRFSEEVFYILHTPNDFCLRIYLESFIYI